MQTEIILGLHIHFKKYLQAICKSDRSIYNLVHKQFLYFRENPKHPSLNFEYLNKNKGVPIASIRVNSDVRIILAEVEKDRYYNAIYIDHHDKAYDFVDRTDISFNSFQKCIQVSQFINLDSWNHDDPLLFDMYSDEDLYKIGIPKNFIPHLKLMRSEDEINNIRGLAHSVIDNLHRLVEKKDIKEIIQNIEKIYQKEAEMGQTFASFEQTSLFSSEVDTFMKDYAEGRIEDWQYCLHPIQRLLVNENMSGSLKVNGIAGTGKTIIGIHRAKFLSQYLVNNQYLLITSYTNSTALRIEYCLKKINVTHPKVICKTIESELRSHYVQKISENLKIEYNIVPIIETMVTGGTLTAEYIATEIEQVIYNQKINSVEEYLSTSRKARIRPLGQENRKLIWEIHEKVKKLLKDQGKIFIKEAYLEVLKYLNNNPDDRKYKFTIIDEYQDLDQLQFEFLRKITSIGRNDLTLLGDPLQSIYLKNYSFKSAGINIVGKATRNIELNYRINQYLLNLAKGIINEIPNENEEEEVSLVSSKAYQWKGTVPTYFLFENLEKNLAFVLKKINEYKELGIPLNQICLASFKKEFSLTTLYNFLRENGIMSVTTKDNYYKEYNSIVLSSLHSIKGNEFSKVILFNIDKEQMPYKRSAFNDLDENEKQQELMNQKKLLYVAVTRAKDELIITGIGEPSEYLVHLESPDRLIINKDNF